MIADPRRLVLLGFFGALAITSWYWLSRENMAPPPAAFIGSGMVYGALAAGSELAPSLAGAMAIGWTLGLLYFVTDPRSNVIGRKAAGAFPAENNTVVSV